MSKKKEDVGDYTSRLGSHGLINYSQRQDETQPDRIRKERYWRSVGKRIRNGSRI